MLTPEADLDFIKAKFCFENLFKQLIKHPHLMRYRQTNSRLGYHRDTAWVQNLEQHFLRGETFVLVLAACLVGSFDSMCCGLIVAQNLAIWELSERARNLILCSKQTTCEVNCDYSLSFCSTLIYLHKHLYIVYTYMYIHTYMKPTLLPFSLHCLLHAVLHGLSWCTVKAYSEGVQRSPSAWFASCSHAQSLKGIFSYNKREVSGSLDSVKIGVLPCAHY